MIACDLGSNTLRIAQFDTFTCKRTRCFEKIVRTAKDLHLTRCIGEEAQTNILNALQEASSLFDFAHEPSFCVTTEAMRVASNAHEVLALIKKEFGLSFNIISGEEEASYTALAIEHALRREGLCDDTYVLFDLGGGSTEITLCYQYVKKSRSFPFGIVTTAERFKEHLDENISSLLSMSDSFLKEEKNLHKTYKQLIATAGTPTTVAAFLQGLDYEHYAPEKVNGKCLHVNDFDAALKELSAMPLHVAERYTGTNRRDLVIVGIVLVKGIMKKLGFESCIVMDDGLREGVAISNCNKAVSS